MTVYGVIRIYRNRLKGYCPDITEKIRHWLEIGVDHIVVVVSDPLDKENTDEKVREAFPADKVSVLLLRSYRDTDYWSIALNEAIQFLAARFSVQHTDKLIIFSNEVSLDSGTLEDMKKTMEVAIAPAIGVVGVKFPGFTAKSYNLFPRNTLAMYRLKLVLELGGFSAECDALGGMEDYYIQRIFKLKGWKCAMVESSGVKLEIAAVTDQSAKEARELAAMEAIDRLLKERFNI